MKKLSIIFAALIAAMTLSAKVVTFDFTNPESLNITAPAISKGTSVNDTTIVKDGVTITFTKGSADSRIWNSSGQYDLRIYKNGGSINISAIENITAVAMTGGAIDFTNLTNNSWIGEATSVSFAANATCKVNSIIVTIGEPAIVWAPDTISVSKAIELIEQKDIHSHYVYGIVAGTAWQSDNTWPGLITFNMVESLNATDTLQAYHIGNGSISKYFKSLEESQTFFDMGDTVLVYASSLSLYAAKNIFEINGGYFVKNLGKSTINNVSANYTYGLGALYQGEEGGKHKWNIAIQVSETDNKGVVFAITNSDNHGIAGNYSLAENSTYNADGTPVAISGSVKIKYASTSATGYNMYEVVSTFKAGNNMYRIEGTYELPGWKADLSDNISLENDVPFTPTSGAEITCAQAKEFALSLESGATSDFEVTVIGYATSLLDAQSNATQQSFWMDDEKGTNKTFEAFYCDLPVGKKVVVGTKVAVTGKVSNYNGTTAEIKNGKIRVIEGGEDVKRTAVIEEIPAGAISVAKAMEIGNALTAEVGKTATTTDNYIVLGYVAKVSYAMKNDTATWFMSDEQGATFGDLQAYKCKIAADIYAGDQVFVIGKIAKYQKDASTANIEIAEGEGHFAALTTDIKEVIATIAEKVKTVKVIVNGQLYIIRDGKTYTTQGILVE